MCFQRERSSANFKGLLRPEGRGSFLVGPVNDALAISPVASTGFLNQGVLAGPGASAEVFQRTGPAASSVSKLIA